VSGHRYRRTHGKSKKRLKSHQETHRVPPKPQSYYRLKKPGRCRWCGETIQESKRRRWHEECVQEYRFRYYPQETRRVIRQRDQTVCAVCGVKDRSWELDHIRPLWEQKGKKGADVDLSYWGEENLQTLCRSCHTVKSSQEATRRALLGGSVEQIEENEKKQTDQYGFHVEDKPDQKG
jgi:5-methylcytosine-specific restriction endonuclease McrA